LPPTAPLAPQFSFPVPKGYLWLLERGLVGFEPLSRLQPWHYLDAGGAFDVTQRWPQGPHPDQLVAFAKRQDRDDLACFSISSGLVTGVVVIHGWTPEGYSVLATHQTFWIWLKSVVDDIAEWSELDG